MIKLYLTTYSQLPLAYIFIYLFNILHNTEYLIPLVCWNEPSAKISHVVGDNNNSNRALTRADTPAVKEP